MRAILLQFESPAMNSIAIPVTMITAPVPMWLAALGGEVEAPCLALGAAADERPCEGDCKVKVKLPEGAQTGRTVRLRGKGMPSLRGRERGDLVVEFFVETPTRLSARQKELLRELAEAPGSAEAHHPQHAGFFAKARKFWDGLTGVEA